MNRIKIFISCLFIIPFCSNAQSWKPAGNFNLNGGISRMYYDSLMNKLIVGTTADTLGGVPVDHIALWNGNNWSAFGAGLNITVQSITDLDGTIYVAGTNHKIYKWDGMSWSVFAQANGPIYVIKAFNHKLYVGGYFLKINGVTVNSLGVWNGTNWASVGGGVSGGSYTVYCLENSDTSLFVGGCYLTVGGITVNNIARWDGTTWHSLGTGASF